MINQFLATLDNTAASPTNFVWPTFTARTITGVEASVRGACIGIGLSRDLNFLRCLQLVNLVQESPLVGYVTAADTRLTYTKQALRDRFTLTGVVVQDTSTPDSSSTLTMIVNSTTPAIAAWSILMTDSTHARITDDLGRVVTQSVTFSSGASNAFDAPIGAASFRFTGAAPSADQSWEISYQANGASWVTEALTRVEGIDPRSLMNDDLRSWYDMAPTSLDRLAAVIATLGTQV